MTLGELARHYDGTVNMSVYAAAEDEKPEFTFPSGIHEKIKDEIMDKEIANYKIENKIIYSEIKVVLAQEVIADQEPEVTE